MLLGTANALNSDKNQRRLDKIEKKKYACENQKHACPECDMTIAFMNSTDLSSRNQENNLAVPEIAQYIYV